MDHTAIASFILSFILVLYGDPQLPRKIVQTVLDHVRDFICDAFLPSPKKDILSALSQERISDTTLQKIDNCFVDHGKVFDKVKTEAKRFSILKKKGLLNYRKIQIGNNFVKNTIGDNARIKSEALYATYVPLKESLKYFLKIPGVFKQTIKYMNKLSKVSNIITNIVQTKLWKRCLERFGNVIVLPLFIFYDDVETGNALGGHAGKNKFGALYTMIGCLPPHIASRLSSIIFTMLVRSEDKKLTSNENVFKVLIDELNFLSREGIRITVNGCEKVVYFQLTLILGDNLGLNSILGMVESFKANHFCRICKIPSEISRMQFIEDTEYLRTFENYDEDVASGIVESTGIKEKCVFNQVDGFHITTNLTVDLLHDIQEGICKYDLREIIYNFVFVKHYFTMEQFNDYIRNFKLGPLESSNKPPPIGMHRVKNRVNMKMSGSEIVCLTRYLGLIIGHLIPEDDENWQLYKYLRKIIDIVTSPRLLPSDIPVLRDLLYEHNQLFFKLHGYLKPKYHMSGHYPTVMEENGPCVHYSGIRFESRHRDLKGTVQSTNSSKNLLITITIKQLLMMCKLFNFSKFDDSFKLGTSDDSCLQARSFFSDDQNCNMKKYKYVEIGGIEIRIGTFLVTSFENSETEFGKVEEIINVNDDIFLYVTIYEEISFNDHVHAYSVKKTTVKKCLNFYDLPEMPPSLSVNRNNEHYLAFRYRL